MKRLGLGDVLYLSLDSLRNQPSLIIPLFSLSLLSFFIFTFVFGRASSAQELVERIPELLAENLNKLLVVITMLYLLMIGGASIVCVMTKVGIARGSSSITEGLQEAEKHVFPVIVAFVIAGVISGILLIGGIIAVTQLISETGILAALLYAFVILLSFMMCILFLYALPAIIIDELDSLTAIGLSIGIVLNHLKDSLILAFLALLSLFMSYYCSSFLSGALHYLFLLIAVSLVLTVLVIAVSVDYVNLK